MPAVSLLQRLAGRPLIRRLTDSVMGAFARCRTVALDRMSVGRVQERTLVRLVRRARHTRFGRDHGFGRIRSVADYQARVPLRTYEDFWAQYWRGPFPLLGGATWPGHIPYLALSSGTTSGATKYVPVSRAMLASNRRAALTTLALFLAANPGTPLFTGRLFFLGGSTDLKDLAKGLSVHGTPAAPVLGGDLSGIVTREASPLLRPFTFPPLEMALLQDWEEKLELLARLGADLPITMLSGVPSWLLVLFDRLRRETGKEHIADVWPGLRLIIHGGTKFEPYRSLFETEVGSPRVHFVETYPASEGFVATEDPRFGRLRLIPDHDIFFEFVPREELQAARPARHTAAQVQPGVQYAVVLTTCAGLWSYVLGDTVCFERLDPPLLRFTGRTHYFLSAFGEHLISEEVEHAITTAATATHSAVADFHVGPAFPTASDAPGHHRYLIEFAVPPANLTLFTRALDEALCRLNEDYRAHRAGDLTLRAPEVRVVRPGGFADWMRSRGKLGGQHKVPRMNNSGALTDTLLHFFD